MELFPFRPLRCPIREARAIPRTRRTIGQCTRLTRRTCNLLSIGTMCDTIQPPLPWVRWKERMIRAMSHIDALCTLGIQNVPGVANEDPRRSIVGGAGTVSPIFIGVLWWITELDGAYLAQAGTHSALTSAVREKKSAQPAGFSPSTNASCLDRRSPSSRRRHGSTSPSPFQLRPTKQEGGAPFEAPPSFGALRDQASPKSGPSPADS